MRCDSTVQESDVRYPTDCGLASDAVKVLARAKARTQRLSDGTSVHSFRSLLADLGTLTKNTVRVPNSSATFDKLANPTPLQDRALQLLSLRARL
jgi:hypothetical protein